MTITVEISRAEALLAELLEKVEAGEDIIFARGANPIARLSRFNQEDEVSRTVERVRAVRQSLPKTTINDIIEWKTEGRQ